MNYFELYSFEEAPVIDKSDLSRRYFELQKKYHPDYYSSATEAEKEEVLEKSSAVNKAFAIFKDEQQTIAYFLKIKGFLEEEEKYSLPAAFLMEMMEINELLDNGQNSDVHVSIESIEQKMDMNIKPIMQGNIDEGNQTALIQIKDYYYRKKYLKRILDRLND